MFHSHKSFTEVVISASKYGFIAHSLNDAIYYNVELSDSLLIFWFFFDNEFSVKYFILSKSFFFVDLIVNG